jgi:hypothetical protein
VIGHSLGEKNGERYGMRLSIAQNAASNPNIKNTSYDIGKVSNKG